MMKKFSIPLKANILAVGVHPDTWERLCLTAILQQKPKLLVMDCTSDMILQLSANSLMKWGHGIHVLDPEQPTCDGIYNPLGAASEVEVFRMARELIADAATPLSFTQAVSLSLLQAIMLYLIRYRSREEQNLTTVLRLLMTEMEETYTHNAYHKDTKLDQLFERVRELNWDDICVTHYDVFRSLDDRDRASIAALLYTHLSELTAAPIQSFTGSDESATKDTLSQGNFLEHCDSATVFFLSHFHEPETVPLRTIICRQILHTLAYGANKETLHSGIIMLSGKFAELVDKNTMAALNRQGIFVMLNIPCGSGKESELGVMCHLITETQALFQKGRIMLDRATLQSPAPDKLSNWNDCTPDDPEKAYRPHLAERNDIKQLEEARKKMKEKREKLPKSRLAGLSREEMAGRVVPNVRPIFHQKELTRNDIGEQLCNNLEEKETSSSTF